MITDEMKKLIGVETEATVIEIEKGMIKRFAQAIGDPNPLWQDEAYAEKSQYGTIVAPPGLLHAVQMFGNLPKLPEAMLERILDGGGEWEYFQPVRAGDALTIVSKLTDLREHEGRMGKMLFVTIETTWKNQRGKLVAKAHSTLICY